MARHTADTTRKEIIQVAIHKFLELGYSNTSAKAISEEVGISTGNLTFHYPTKEHLLAKLVDMLCTFQWRMMEKEAEDEQDNGESDNSGEVSDTGDIDEPENKEDE